MVYCPWGRKKSDISKVTQHACMNTHIHLHVYSRGNSVILESDRTKFGAGFYPLLTTISSKGGQVRYHQHSRVPGTGETFNRELLDCKRTVSVYFLKLDSLGRIPAQSLPV